MTRVLLLSPTAVPGGAERALVNLARHLPSHGFELSAVLLSDGPLRGWLEHVGCPATVVPAGRTRHLHRTVSVTRRLAQLARQADVVISNQSKGHVYGGLAARIAGRSAVWWQHGVPSRSAIEIVAAAIPVATIVCGSRIAVDAQRRMTPSRRIQLISPGTAVDTIASRVGSGQVVRERLGWADKQVVGIVGRLQPWKGQEVFLRAAAQIAQHNPEARFAVVGGAVLGWEGDYPQRLQRLAGELGIGHLVHFAGHQDDVYPWLDAMDVVVHASFGEPFGLVLVEAMTLSRPLVATAVGGPLEIVEDGVSGLLVPPGDGAALAAAVDRILDSPDFAKSLGTAALLRAEKFSAGRTAKSFAELLLRISAPTSESCSGLRAPFSEMTEEPNPDFDENAMAGRNTHAVVATLVEPACGGTILDVGAGQGAFTARLARKGEHVVALGSVPEQFRATAPFVVCDLDRGLPIASASVSGIVAIEIVEHLENGYQLIREAARCVTQGGWVVLTTPNILSLSSRVSGMLRGYPIYFGERDYETNGHIHPISLLDIQRMADRSGLVVEAVTYNIGKLPIPRIRHRYPLEGRIFRNAWFGESLIVKLRKVSGPRREFVRG